MELRPARPEEADLLGRMVLAGVAHWGHDVNFPEAFEGLRRSGLPDVAFVAAHRVDVLDDGDEIVGFYSLVVGDGHVELVHMFLAVERIGTGCGRRLWDRAVKRARGLGPTLLIMADPAAKGFYAAMGAELEDDVEVAPGFALGRMWYDLDQVDGRGQV
jgi:GNAT superfamily N-acetyltransferase